MCVFALHDYFLLCKDETIFLMLPNICKEILKNN